MRLLNYVLTSGDSQKDTKQTSTNDFPKTKKEISTSEKKLLMKITKAPDLVDNVLYVLSDKNVELKEFMYQLKFYSISESSNREVLADSLIIDAVNLINFFKSNINNPPKNFDKPKTYISESTKKRDLLVNLTKQNFYFQNIPF